MTDDTAFDRERIAKLKERAHKAHGDDASYRTAWLQYHSALQAAFERGTLVFVAQPKPDDDLADRLRVILPKVTPDWMLDGRTVYSLRRGENSWQAQFTQDGRHLTPWAEVEANAQLSQLAPQTATAYLAALDQIAALTAQLAEARATITESGWQPIETAPSARDNVDVLVWGPHLARVEFRLADGDWWRAPGTPKPTHWRPIPKGPSE